MSVSASAKGLDGQRRIVPRRVLTDARLARMAATGDEAAFEEIFRRYQEELYRYCRAILSDPHEAQDALQNAMASALRALPGEEREISLRPWLYRVAHNEAISITRRRVEPAMPADELVDTVPSAGTDADDRERLRELVADLRRLPERQRGALVMRELSGLGYSQIALVLGCSDGAARQAVHEAREALREARRGREMQCAEIREVISVRDGRRVRGKAIRAHLRTCEGCQDFRTAISQRSADLRALTPALPAVTVGGLLATVTSGGSTGATGVATGTGAAAAGAGGTAVVAKGNALVAALVIGAGAAGVSGTMDMPFGGGSGGDSAPGEANEAGEAPGGAFHHGGHEPAVLRDMSAVSGPENTVADKSRADADRAGAGQTGDDGEAGQQGQADESDGAPASLAAGAAAEELPATSQGSSPPGHSVGSSHAPPASDHESTMQGESGEDSNAGNARLAEQETDEDEDG